MKSWKIVLSLVAVMMVGCSYQVPIKDKEQTATVRFADVRVGKNPLAVEGMPTTIRHWEPETCKQRGRLGEFRKGVKEEQKASIPAGRPVYFHGTTSSFLFDLRGMMACEVVGGFVAAPRGLYELRMEQNVETMTCTMLLFDLSKAKGTPLVLLPPPAHCNATEKERK